MITVKGEKKLGIEFAGDIGVCVVCGEKTDDNDIDFPTRWDNDGDPYCTECFNTLQDTIHPNQATLSMWEKVYDFLEKENLTSQKEINKFVINIQMGASGLFARKPYFIIRHYTTTTIQ